MTVTHSPAAASPMACCNTAIGPLTRRTTSGTSPASTLRATVLAATLASMTMLPAANAGVPHVRPDIILILADDLGFSDLSCQGGEISTPNIDRLAAEGARFTAASSAARCCPSRACLLTGAYSHRVGMGWMTQADLGRPAYRSELTADCATLPEVLAGAGYRSFMSGKWHLTAEKYSQSLPATASWPTRRGFDRFFGILGGGSSYTAPAFLVRNETPVQPGPGFQLTDAISDAAVEFIQAPLAGPRFIYVAYTAPHRPLHAAPQAVERNLKTYAAGYERIGRARVDRLRKLGLLAPGQPAAPNSWPDWTTLTPDIQADQARRMAAYAAQIQDMDRGVGRILDAVAHSGRAENTLIIFASDNGASAEMLEAPPLPANLTNSLRSSYGKAWAAISNLPFRGSKSEPLQGGVATPLFVRWPAHVAAGQRIADPVHLIDVLPTCAAAAGAPLPRRRQPHALVQPDGISFLPALAGQTLPARNIFFEHEGGRAVRRGPLKAVALAQSQTWQLYDLASDPAELHDLSGQRPAELQSLKKAWTQWAEANGVVPLDSRNWGQRTANPEGWRQQ
ncbi:MAG: sulfatase-like hydrolase/transferase [bacterium]|nr:sulfatase-like hydrolase/transferase [bacterium]